MKVIQLKGLDADLYPLIGPLVMNPKVLKANNNYPFKTTENYQWYIAVDDQEEAVGFLPVEDKKNTSVINNYYLKEDNGELLKLLFSQIDVEKDITAIVLSKHLDIFKKLGFKLEHQWTNYIKMIYTNTNKNEEKGN